jgi:ParB family chromosome partitioning protein
MPSGLGRGLGSLIPQKPKKSKASYGEEGDSVAVNVLSPQDENRIILVSPEEIVPNELQPRKMFTDSHLNELMDSIKTYGIIQPLVVTKKGNKYELIAGERRLRASSKIGLKEIPIIVRKIDEQNKLEIALVENLQREDLNVVEKALAYQKLIDEFNLNINELAKRVGKSRPVISNSLRVLSLPEEIQEALMRGVINEGHANLLCGLEGEVKQLNVFRKIVNGDLSVRGASQEIRKIGGTKNARIKDNNADKLKEEKLRNLLATKVEIKRTQKGGKIIIDFYSDGELDKILKKIK